MNMLWSYGLRIVLHIQTHSQSLRGAKGCLCNNKLVKFFPFTDFFKAFWIIKTKVSFSILLFLLIFPIISCFSSVFFTANSCTQRKKNYHSFNVTIKTWTKVQSGVYDLLWTILYAEWAPLSQLLGILFLGLAIFDWCIEVVRGKDVV